LKIKKNKSDTYITNISIPSIDNSLIKYGVFNPSILLDDVYWTLIMNEYNDVIMPYRYSIYECKKWDIFKLTKSINIVSQKNKAIKSLVVLKMHKCYSTITTIIYWYDKDNYYINEYINLCLRRIINYDNYRFILLDICLLYKNGKGTHSNIVIYDKKYKTVVRFEPHGDKAWYNHNDLDNLIKQIFTNAYGDILYISPSDFLCTTKFQMTSWTNEDDNIGDPGGFCLAWSIWFVKLKLMNKDLHKSDNNLTLDTAIDDHKKLVEKSLYEIMKKTKNSPNVLLSYIRDFSRKITNEKNKLLLNIGVCNDDLYKINISDKQTKIIVKYLDNFIINKLKIN